MKTQQRPASPTPPAASAADDRGGVRLPPALRRGDLVGIAALSGPVDGVRLEAGCRAIEKLGFRTREAANLRSRQGLFAGSDAERLDAFHRLAADSEVRAIVFARGGHGVLRLLPDFDWELLRLHPRAYVGYSDLTPFLLQVVERLGLVSFHGPMIAADWARGLSEAEARSWRGALGGEFPLEFEVRCDAATAGAEGRLIGGCLSLLAATLGTPYAPRLESSLLFVEDVAEPAYRLDRMLTHLYLSGNLSTIQGMILGHFSDCGPAESRPQDAGPPVAGVSEPDAEGLSPRRVLEGWARRLSVPCCSGLAAGHQAPNLTVPLGLWARLDPARQRLLIEPPTEGTGARG